MSPKVSVKISWCKSDHDEVEEEKWKFITGPVVDLSDEREKYICWDMHNDYMSDIKLVCSRQTYLMRRYVYYYFVFYNIYVIVYIQ